MSRIDSSVVVHQLNVDPKIRLVRQKKRVMDAARNVTTAQKVGQLLKANLLRELEYPNWLSNVVLVRKPNGNGGCASISPA